MVWSLGGPTASLDGPHVIKSMDHCWNCQRQPSVRGGGNLLQCHSVHHRCHVDISSTNSIEEECHSVFPEHSYLLNKCPLCPYGIGCSSENSVLVVFRTKNAFYELTCFYDLRGFFKAESVEEQIQSDHKSKSS
jgi:hypothetical protein